MGLLDYFADFKAKRKAAEAADWVKYRSGEGSQPMSFTGTSRHMDKDIIIPRAKAMVKRTNELPSDKSISGLAQYIRKPRLWQGK